MATVKTAGKTSARSAKKKWSGYVTETSDALGLDKGVFSKADPKQIARSLKRSASKSRKRKSSPYHSAMSMLSFYINRAGKKLSKKRIAILEKAKTELKKIFSRDKK